MPYRAMGLLLSIFGVITILLLWLLRRDVHLLADSGPAWFRRILVAGLVLLGVFTGGACDSSSHRTTSSAPVQPASTETSQPTTTATQDPAAQHSRTAKIASAWAHFDQTWDMVVPILSGDGAIITGTGMERQFTLAMKPEATLLLKELRKAKDDVRLLADLKELNPTEKKLLDVRLDAMIGVLSPTDHSEDYDAQEQAVCRQFVETLRLLKKESVEPKISGRAAARILQLGDSWPKRNYLFPGEYNIECDLVPKYGKEIETLPEEARSAAAVLASRIHVDSRELTATVQWKRLMKVWSAAEGLLSPKMAGAYPFTSFGRSYILSNLRLSMLDMKRLRSAGLLNNAEASFLTDQLQVMVEAVRWYRSFEDFGGTCYSGIPNVPPYATVEQLQARVPLIEKTAHRHVVPAEVIYTSLVTAERQYYEECVLGGEKEEAIRASLDRAESFFRHSNPQTSARCWKELRRLLQDASKSNYTPGGPRLDAWAHEFCDTTLRAIAAGSLTGNEGFVLREYADEILGNPPGEARDFFAYVMPWLKKIRAAGPMTHEFARMIVPRLVTEWAKTGAPGSASLTQAQWKALKPQLDSWIQWAQAQVAPATSKPSAK